MDIVGKIIYALPEVSGVSKNGNNWKKREYVLETQETYPKKIHFDFFGEKADQFPLQVGQVIRLYFDIESREYQGRWYTSIRGWKYDDPMAAQAMPAADPAAAYPGAPAAPAYGAPAAAPAYPGAPAAAPVYPGAVPPPPMTPSQPTDDLPF